MNSFKKTLVLSVAVCSLAFGSSLPSAFSADGKGETLKWTGISKGLEQAKAEHKFVLADFYTDWCGWCKRLDKDTFTDPGLIEFLQSKFVTVKCNAEDKGEGQRAAEASNVYSYPYALIYDGNGKVLGKVAGYMPAEKYKAAIERVIKNANP